MQLTIKTGSAIGWQPGLTILKTVMGCRKFWTEGLLMVIYKKLIQIQNLFSSKTFDTFTTDVRQASIRSPIPVLTCLEIGCFELELFLSCGNIKWQLFSRKIWAALEAPCLFPNDDTLNVVIPKKLSFRPGHKKQSYAMRTIA